jgi:hypothetical protein
MAALYQSTSALLMTPEFLTPVGASMKTLSIAAAPSAVRKASGSAGACSDGV